YLPSGDDNDVTHSFEIGIVDPVYDMTYPQIGEESRSLHKSQGMGVDLPVEPRQFNLELIKKDRKSTRLNSSHVSISYAVFCLKKKNVIELLNRELACT